MLTIDKIKGIIFDYGGTIDSNGLHWAEVIWKAYETYQVSVAKADFRNAFVYGERTLGKNPLVKPEHTFLDMLRIKIDLQLEWLKDEGLITPADASSQKKEDIAQLCKCTETYRHSPPDSGTIGTEISVSLGVQFLRKHRIRLERFPTGSSFPDNR